MFITSSGISPWENYYINPYTYDIAIYKSNYLLITSHFPSEKSFWCGDIQPRNQGRAWLGLFSTAQCRKCTSSATEVIHLHQLKEGIACSQTRFINSPWKSNRKMVGPFEKWACPKCDSHLPCNNRFAIQASYIQGFQIVAINLVNGPTILLYSTIITWLVVIHVMRTHIINTMSNSNLINTRKHIANWLLRQNINYI